MKRAALLLLLEGVAVHASNLSGGFAGNRALIQKYDQIRREMVVEPQVALQKAWTVQRTASSSRNAQPLDEAAATALVAEGLWRVGRPKDALLSAERAQRMVRGIAPQSFLAADILVTDGAAASALGQVQRALNDYQTAHSLYVRLNIPAGEALSLQRLGAMYRNAGDYDGAIKHYLQAGETPANDPRIVLSINNNLGIAYSEVGRWREASLSYRKALVTAQSLNDPLLAVRILQNLAQTQSLAGTYRAATATLDQGYRIARSGPAAVWRPALDGVAAEVALRQGRLDRAASLIERTFADAGEAATAMPMKDFHRTAYEIFKAKGDEAAALTHLEAFKKLDDADRVLAASTNAALMAARFDFANQDLKISRLEVSQARARAHFRETVTAGLLAAAAVISTLLAIAFISIRRSRNQVRAVNATLTTTNAQLGKALAAKSEFLATTSHEIRTPLNGILGMTQVILADRALAGPLRNRIELVHGAGETMRALVDDILDVAKMETGELRLHPAEMNLLRLLQDAATMWNGQAETKRIAVALDVADCPVGIVADEVRLRQIVFNLMSNAIKFTDRGTVALAVRAVPGEGGTGERLVITVRDSGIGIPPDRLEDIFESFRQVDGGTTRRHGGTGLGLAICRTLARAMGGDVTVASVFGAGATFTLDLPLLRADVPVAPEAGTRTAPASLAEAELVLLEANPLAQGILRALLAPKARGLRVVAQPEEALAALAAGGVDHLIADGGAIGLDPVIAERLAVAAEAAHARLTLLWPSPDQDTMSLLNGKGISHLLAKPLSANDLLAALQFVYGSATASHDIAA